MHADIRLANADMEVVIEPQSPAIRLLNPATGAEWILDLASVRAVGPEAEPPRYGGPAPDGAKPDCIRAAPMALAQCERCGANAARLTWRGVPGVLVTTWELRSDGLDITAHAGVSTVTSCALPGVFRPHQGSIRAVVPLCQGIVHGSGGGTFALNMTRNGHSGWSMPFAALMGERDALLQIAVDEHDARLWFEKTADGLMNLAWVQDATRGLLRYDRTTRLRFTAPTPAAVALAYRAEIQRSGHLVTWDAKIAERPNIEKLFGAVMCFIGYCRDDQLDYAAGFRRLKAMGVDQAFVYPLSIGNVVENFQMGGRDPIDIRRHLGLLNDLGYLAASWMWVEDVPAEPIGDLLLNRKGEPHFSWQIEAVKWYKSCPVRGVAIANRIQEARMAGHNAQHFDVTASRAGFECHHPDHPVDRREDAAWRRKILETAARRGNVVSSEGFWGYATPSYDIGSVKIPRAVHDGWYTVPLTSLVYHDSCIHDWWEVDNYNNAHHASQGVRANGYFPMGGGHQEHQALQDALAGWPPNVMPFGAQYQYVNGVGPATELYRYELDMPEVRRALALALPVARLHKRIGRLACVDHQVLATDGTVQSTTFSDGTTIFANFGNESVEAPGAGRIPPLSWLSRP